MNLRFVNDYMTNLTNHSTSKGAEFMASIAVFGILFCLVYFSQAVLIVGGDTYGQNVDAALTVDEREEIESGGLEEFVQTDKKETDNVVSDLLVPSRITAPSISLEAEIIIPSSTEVDVLDSALLDGVVYYPDSGFLGKDSNIFLFGHSSFLPVVRNQNFRVFNRIKDLRIGDMIILESDGESFEYRVMANRLVKDHEVRIDFDTELSMLTLVTCNSFGQKEDRYIIEAVLVD